MSAFESFDEIRTYVRLVDEKSLSSAARALRVSVNAVWRRLERIEERAGAKLVERTTRALRVTPAGERLAVHARRILEELDASDRGVATPAETLRGTVRIAVPEDVANAHFIAEIGDLLSRSPQLSVEIVGRSRLIEPVAAGVDLMLWVGPLDSQSATVRKLGVVDWVLTAAPSYIARHGAPRAPEELSEHRCLLALKSKKETIFHLVDANGLKKDARVSGQFEADLPGVLLSALYAGLGIGMRPLREVEEGVERGKLVRVLPEYRLEPMEVSLIAPAGRLRVAAVRAVADVLGREVRRQAGGV
jgi:DNA-binding transcriptional LysR family regulator